jgi:hypothetical protein
MSFSSEGATIVKGALCLQPATSRTVRCSVEAIVAAVQGSYYLVTGLWPLFSRGSFEAVTGPKNDFWLVQTLGLLIAAVGCALLVSSSREKPSPEAVALGVGSAAALGGAGAVFALRGRISKIYLADAGLEALLIVAWAASQNKKRVSNSDLPGWRNNVGSDAARGCNDAS